MTEPVASSFCFDISQSCLSVFVNAKKAITELKDGKRNKLIILMKILYDKSLSYFP